MKPSSIGSCVDECDGCDRQDPGDDLRRRYWHHSAELDLDLCPSCWDRLDDSAIFHLAWEKMLPRIKAKIAAGWGKALAKVTSENSTKYPGDP